ncbi:hypothetical protein GF339_21870 [candidate division KSB3 bacterium]|uniref:C4-type zinc ribbon domain-containing protein n=1 Tax=candidate division KSB3 bacterium TaxID=2044937 RepID=A0A9D5JZY3_9BACT|nr:hypothetical protein [candidate division KSB3 bacterium]MBD3327250.1 hypothetical protein [candidate division KSB3 bacterium]
MNTTLETLINLQHVDRVILEIQQKIDQCPLIIQQLDKRLQESEDRIQEIEHSLENQEKARRSKEMDVESNLEKIKKYQGQLLQVKTNKEYTALLNEIKTLKNKNSLTEDDIIELMEGIERTKNALSDAQEDLAQQRARTEQEKQAQEAERQRLEQELHTEHAQRETLAAQVDPSVYNEYAKLFKLRNGLAVVSVEKDGVCRGCFVALTPQMFAEVRGGDFIHRCPTCFRFLYWSQDEDQSGDSDDDHS